MDGEKIVIANKTVDNDKAEPSKAEIVSEIEDNNKAEPHEAPMKKNAKTARRRRPRIVYDWDDETITLEGSTTHRAPINKCANQSNCIQKENR